MARASFATVEGPPPADYSGFLDMTDGDGYACDPYGPMAGNPQVGFDDTRLTGTGPNDGDFPLHWSRTDTSDPEENLLHRWFTGTDDDEHFGFFTIVPDFSGLSTAQQNDLFCRYPALADENPIVDVRLRGHAWEEGAPYENWGITLAWALREAFHDLDTLPIQVP